MYRPTWIEIDREAIAHNIREIKTRMGEQQVMAVVKADGYGHGAVTVAEIALENGADLLAVALLEEAIELRESHAREKELAVRQAAHTSLNLTGRRRAARKSHRPARPADQRRRPHPAGSSTASRRSPIHHPLAPDRELDLAL